MPKKLLFLLLPVSLLAISAFKHFKPIAGKYIGYELWRIPVSYDTISKKYIPIGEPEYGKKELTIFKNGRFTLKCPDFWPRPNSAAPTYCSGHWVKKNDELTLNSKYQYTDFISVEEFYIPSTDPDLVKIKIQYETGSTWSVKLSLDSTEIGDSKINDTVYCKFKDPKTISLSRYTPDIRNWLYRIVNPAANCFSITLKTDIKKQNIVLENYQLLITDSSLIPLDKKLIETDERNFVKQN